MATQIVEIRAVDKTRKALGDINTRLGRIDKNAQGISASFGKIAGLAATVFAGLGLSRVASGVLTASRRFEDLRATLVTIEGSASKAAKSFSLIEEFTAGTPFQLDEVTEAFIKFKNAGLEPTTEFMTNVGNIAAGMGKRIDDVAQAVFNATTGEFEMLKQLGVKVKVEGDKLRVNFRGTATEIENDGKAIIGFLNDIGKTEFAGSIERQSKTLTGSISNMQDALDKFSATIGESGVQQALGGLIRTITGLIQGSNDLAKTIGEELGFMFFKLNEFIKESNFDMGNFIQGAKIAAAVLGGAGLVKVLQMAATGVKNLTLAIARNPLGLMAVAAASLITYLSMENGLGKTISQVTAVFKVMGRMAESVARFFRNSLGKVIDFLAGIFDDFVDSVISGYNALAEFIPFLDKIETTGKEVREGLKNLAIEGFEVLSDTVEDTIQIGKDFINTNELAQKALESGKGILAEITTAWQNAGYSYDEAEKKARAQYEQLIKTNKGLSDQGDAADDATDGTNNLTTATEQLTKAQQKLNDASLGLGQTKALKEQQDSLIEFYDKNIKKATEANEFIRVGKETLISREILLEEEKFDKLETLNENFYKAIDSMHSRNIERRLKADMNYLDTLEGALDKDFLKRKGNEERQGKIVKDRIEFEKKSELEKTQFGLEQATTLFSGLSKVNKKFFAAQKAAAIALAIVNTYQGATKALATYPPPFNFIAAAATVASGLAQVATIRAQTMQRGGALPQGQAAIVGEDGPELIVPKQSSTIIPREVADAIDNMGGGNNGPVVVNFNISTVDAQGFDELLIRRRGTITGIINNALTKQGKQGVIG